MTRLILIICLSIFLLSCNKNSPQISSKQSWTSLGRYSRTKAPGGWLVIGNIQGGVCFIEDPDYQWKEVNWISMGERDTRRTKVPGGWLVVEGHKGGACFVPDPKQNWAIK